MLVLSKTADIDGPMVKVRTNYGGCCAILSRSRSNSSCSSSWSSSTSRDRPRPRFLPIKVLIWFICVIFLMDELFPFFVQICDLGTSSPFLHIHTDKPVDNPLWLAPEVQTRLVSVASFAPSLLLSPVFFSCFLISFRFPSCPQPSFGCFKRFFPHDLSHSRF